MDRLPLEWRTACRPGCARARHPRPARSAPRPVSSCRHPAPRPVPARRGPAAPRRSPFVGTVRGRGAGGGGVTRPRGGVRQRQGATCTDGHSGRLHRRSRTIPPAGCRRPAAPSRLPPRRRGHHDPARRTPAAHTQRAGLLHAQAAQDQAGRGWPPRAGGPGRGPGARRPAPALRADSPRRELPPCPVAGAPRTAIERRELPRSGLVAGPTPSRTARSPHLQRAGPRPGP